MTEKLGPGDFKEIPVRPDDAGDAALASETDAERKMALKKLYGVTEPDLEDAASAFLKAHVLDASGENITTVEQPFTELGLDLFRKSPLDTYKGTLDQDQKAVILNERLVQTDESGLFATPQTLRSLSTLVKDHTQKGLETYRSDEVTSLTHDNLLAVANSFAGTPEYEAVDPLSQALEAIQESAEDDDDKPIDRLKDEIFREMVDRLLDDTMEPQERASFISTIESTLTESLLLMIADEQPDVLLALRRNAQEFSNDSLREILTRDQRLPILDFSPDEETDSTSFKIEN